MEKYKRFRISFIAKHVYIHKEFVLVKVDPAQKKV